MRVLCVSPRFAPDVGGVERVVADSATALVALGVDVVVITSAPKGRPRRERVPCVGGSYEIVRVPRSRYQHPELVGVGFVAAVRREAAHVDVVHVHSYHALTALMGAIGRRRRPMVASLHYHGGGHSRLRAALHRIYKPFGTWLVSRAAIVTCNTSAEQGLVQRDFPNADTVVVSTPVHVHQTATARVSDSPGRRRPLVCSVSRLEPYKRVDVLVEAARLDDARFDLVVVGDGSDLGRLERLAAGAPNIRFTGRCDDDELAAWWRQADLVASASEDESFGIVVAQALASGVRCVASAIDAHRELVSIAGRGSLVDNWDPAAWSHAIGESLQQPVPRPADAFCTPDTYAATLIAIYEEIRSTDSGC